MRITPLNDGWQFKCRDDGPGYYRPNVQVLPWLPAEVPGAVHLDLVRHGIIAEPMARQFEYGCRWVDEREWHYRKSFSWTPNPAHPRRVLKFHGLDTICTIFLNGAEIGKSDNFFLPLEIDVTDRLEAGSNELLIVFESAEAAGKQRRADYFQKVGLPHNTTWFDERAFVRKPGYMFAWDWGPRLLGAGLWQPVELLEFESRIKEISWRQEPAGKGFHIWAEADIEGDAKLTTQFAGQTSASNEYELDLELWWPNGEGLQTLHKTIAQIPGQTIEKSIGLRTIKLLQTPDEIGESFEFEINGRKIYSRGANWIPNDSFPGRITAEDYEDQIAKAKQLNMNMLRVWGGGLYETDAFYDACDRHGILVWQDFPYACSYYPDDTETQAEAAREAEFHVRRLRDHASLAIWCGNNENLILWEGKWGGTELSPDRYYGEPIYEKVLREAVATYDPATPYIPTSPGFVGAAEVKANSNGFGDQHYWEVWHGQGDWNNYANSHARFCSEFGFASSCSLAQWEDVNGSPTLENLDAPFAAPEGPSPEVTWHDKTGKPFETFRGYVELHYPVSQTLDDWIYYSQLNQRDSFRFGIEHYRRLDSCRGALIWQMNDCWPVQSWAVQDYARLFKPAGHELKRLYSPVMISLEVGPDLIKAWVVNDSAESIETKLQASVIDTLSAEVIHTEAAAVSLATSSRQPAFTLELSRFEPNRYAIKFWLEGVPGSERWHLASEPKDLRANSPIFRASCSDGMLRLDIEGFAADLVVWDPIDPENLVSTWTGVPGIESHTIANGSIDFTLRHQPHMLWARSLAGLTRIDLA